MLLLEHGSMQPSDTSAASVSSCSLGRTSFSSSVWLLSSGFVAGLDEVHVLLVHSSPAAPRVDKASVSVHQRDVCLGSWTTFSQLVTVSRRQGLNDTKDGTCEAWDYCAQIGTRYYLKASHLNVLFLDLCHHVHASSTSANTITKLNPWDV